MFLSLLYSPLTLSIHKPTFCLYRFLNSGLLCECNHIICGFLWLASFIQIMCQNVHFEAKWYSILWNNIPFTFTTFLKSICHLMDIWLVSTFGLLWIPLPSILMCKLLHVHIFISLGYRHRNGTTGYMVSLCVIFLKLLIYLFFF